MSREGKGWAVVGSFDEINHVFVGANADSYAYEMAAKLRDGYIAAEVIRVTITEDNRNE